MSRKREVEQSGTLEGAQTQKPIIALTASVFEDEQQQVLEAGCNMLLRKPVSAPELFEALRSYLGVEYRYEADEWLPDAPRPRNARNALTPEALAGLPDALFDRLKHAVISGNQAMMMEMVETIREQNAELADNIRPLVHNFKYQVLWEMIQQSTPQQNSRNEGSSKKTVP